ncbi:MAG: gfo/Idh/MocA family oxidoreductase [Desulfonatronospira sp. MSAO_Bac3]|nr:MAG: gfo/Idh/MocA family oxidoreductase [Desulfonatronospira sp. MSAO_Bac3]
MVKEGRGWFDINDHFLVQLLAAQIPDRQDKALLISNNRHNNMDKLDLGIIGVGHLGSIHARLAAQSEKINLVGVFDLDQERAEKAARDSSTECFRDMHALLEKVQGVSIVVPTSEHHSVALKALDYGCHLFLEKPIASSVDQARDIVQKAREKNRKIQVGHIERFNPAILAIKDHPLKPMFIEAHRLSTFNPRGCDVSVVLDLMIHDLDLILYLVKSPVTHVDACGVAVVSREEDIANVRLKFASGCVANITSSRIALSPMRRMRLFQQNQYIALDFQEKKADIFKLTDQDTIPDPGCKPAVVSRIGVGDNARDVIYEKPSPPEVNSLQMELEEFAKAVVHDLEPEVPGEQGLMALETAANILEQIARP